MSSNNISVNGNMAETIIIAEYSTTLEYSTIRFLLLSQTNQILWKYGKQLLYETSNSFEIFNNKVALLLRRKLFLILLWDVFA